MPPRSARTRRPPRRLGVALVLVFTALLTACGSGSDDGDLLETFAAAAETTGAAESVHTRMVVSFEDIPELEGQEFVTEGDMSMDGRNGRGSSTQAGPEIEFLIVDGDFYYAVPDLPDGATWLRMTADDLQALTGMDLDSATNESPVESLARLEASGDIEEIGDEDIDGVATTHYRATIDVDKMAEATDFMSDELVDQLKGLFGETYEIEVWIDGDGFVRRMTYFTDLAAAPDVPAGLPSEGVIRYEISMSGFGDPIDVTAPAEEDVLDFSDLN